LAVAEALAAGIGRLSRLPGSSLASSVDNLNVEVPVRRDICLAMVNLRSGLPLDGLEHAEGPGEARVPSLAVASSLIGVWIWLISDDGNLARDSPVSSATRVALLKTPPKPSWASSS
jgi:hypothetical protein